MNKQSLKKVAKIARRSLPRYYSENKKARLYYVKHWQSAKIKEKTILYEVRDGQSMTDSPLALFLYIVGQPEFKYWQHVWVVRSESVKNELLVNIPEKFHDLITYVVRDSVDYSKWLLAAKYLITNSTFNFFWHKRAGQIYINTWHGTPLKYMGYDIPGNKTSLKNVQRNLLMTDFLISPNKHTTHIFFDRYKLNGLYEGQILESGYPRNDVLQKRDATIKDQLIEAGLVLLNKPIVLYTPTWKGTSINNPAGSLEQIYSEVMYLQSKHPDLQILLKVHPYAYQQAKSYEKLRKLLIPDQFDPGRVLSITDILITDYSSIFFDFEITERPIIFYTWDKEQYQNYRGMYFEDDELPGPVLDSIKDVSDYLSRVKNIKQTSQYSGRKLMTSHDDGQVTKRIVNRIFKKINDDKISDITTVEKKKKILIFSGGMVNNGISSSLINLTKNIDYGKYDVSILAYDSNQTEKVNNINRLDNHVRLIYRMGTPAFTLFEQVCDLIITKFGINFWTSIFYPKRAYQREAHRLLSGYQFDTAIDFSGYSFNGAKIIAEANAKNKIIFQHNDLWSDAHKVVNGIKPNFDSLMALFSLYFKFNKIISVSEPLSEINAKKLNKYIKDEQVNYLENTLNLECKSDIKRADDQNIIITDIDRIARVNNKALEAYQSIKDITNNHSVVYQTHGTEFRAVSRVQYLNSTFFRITEDGLPSMWLNADNVEIDTQEYILSEEDWEQVGWLKKNNQYIWTAPFGVNEDVQIIGRGWLIEYTFVNVTKKVNTTDGLYLRIQLPKMKQQGYIKASSLQLLAQSNMTVIQKIWNRLFNKQIEFSFVPINQAIIVTENATTYVQPQGLMKRFDKINKKVRMLPMQMANAKATTKLGDFYRIGEIDNMVWVADKDVKLFNAKISFSGYNTTISEISNSENGKLDMSETSYFTTENFGEEIEKRQLIARFKNSSGTWQFLCNQDHTLRIVPQEQENQVTRKAMNMLEDSSLTEKQILKKHSIAYSNIDLVEVSKPKKYGSFISHRQHNVLETIDEIEDWVKFNNIVQSQAFIFSTMGRFSPEKNQIMLIKAFLKIMTEVSTSSYLVFLGEGKMKKDVEQLVEIYGIRDHVLFLGQVENPQNIIKRTDAFVLPSAFEGQPMVLLEVMSIKVPIIASNIKANFGVLGDQKYGMLINDFSVDGLAESMMNSMLYQYIFDEFDPESYNEQVMKRFDSLIGE